MVRVSTMCTKIHINVFLMSFVNGTSLANVVGHAETVPYKWEVVPDTNLSVS